VLTDEIQKETKRLIAECCEQRGLTFLALETDEDHIHVERSKEQLTNMCSNVLEYTYEEYL
jgi:REP element-mobilizing transposase RayT